MFRLVFDLLLTITVVGGCYNYCTRTGVPTDGHRLCCLWAYHGECNTNPLYMRTVCQKSCGTPGCTINCASCCPTNVNVVGCPYIQQKQPVTQSLTHLCCFWAYHGECWKNPAYMNRFCVQACNNPRCKITVCNAACLHDGEEHNVGKVYTIDRLQYKCTNSGSKMVGCLRPNGKKVKVSGTWKEGQFAKQCKKSGIHVTGCYTLDGVKKGLGKEWIQQNIKRVCQKVGKQEAMIDNIACVTDENIVIMPGQKRMINNVEYSCEPKPAGLQFCRWGQPVQPPVVQPMVKVTNRASDAKMRKINKLLVKRVERVKEEYESLKKKYPKWKSPSREKGSKEQHNEMSVRRKGYFFDGDLVLTKKQANIIIEQLSKEYRRRSKRKVYEPHIAHRWIRFPIPYEFANNVPGEVRTATSQSIEQYRKNTCIRFNEQAVHGDGIRIINGSPDLEGCWSRVGRIGNVQDLSLQYDRDHNCATVGIAAHEIGHALGLAHEHQQPKKLKAVVAHNLKIPNAGDYDWRTQYTYKTDKVNPYGQPYDYGSIMHYGPYNDEAAIIISQPVLEPYPTPKRLANYFKTIGQRNGPSFIDYAQINTIYCKQLCSARHCERNGYANPNNCSQCLCPSGFEPISFVFLNQSADLEGISSYS